MRLGGSLTTPSAALRTAQHNVEILTERLADDKRQLALRGLLWPLVAALLTFVAWQPFVRLDFDLWRADDGEYHLLRVYVFEAAVRAGEWLPRWTPDLFVGYGYPIFNFYAPGTYYLAMLLRLLGWDVYTTVQAQGAIATCAGAAGAYCLARAVFGGTLPGLTAALAFAYAPYPFITNLVIRADLAETLGLALLPWTLLAAWEAGRRPRHMAVLLLAGAMAAVILTHNLTALVTLPAAAVVGGFAAWHPGAVRGRRGTTETPTAATETAATAASGYPLKEGVAPNGRGPGDAVLDGRNGHPGLEAATAATPAGAQGQTGRRAGLGAVAGGLGAALLLTAFFWLPALVEQRDVHIEVALDGGHKAARTWLIDPLGATEQTRRSGNPQTVHGPLDLHLAYPYDLNYPPKPSLGQGALFAASAALTLAGLIARRRRVAGAAFFGAGTILLWLLTTTWSGWAWDHVPLMRFLQFSWRLYGPLALALGLAAAGAVAVAPGPLKLLPPLLALLLAANTTTARPLWIDPEVERRVGGPQLVGTENATFGAGTTTGGEFVPRTVDLEALGPGRRRGNGVYERLYPEFGWLGGRVWVMQGRVRVAELAGGPTWTDARVVAETPGVLAFRTVAFPGWRAYLDGRPVEPQLAPRDAALDVAPGFITVPVPAGEHRVQIAFGPTPLRTAAAALSVLAVAGLGWWLAAGRRPAPQERAPTFPARRGAARRWPVARIAALTP
ncbi:MAG TPA: hypothetical protein VHN78_09165, partial [Chloroflexota bacterium]|nr:hypothetical protein [Chloroflexota bacterium]